MTKQEVLAKYFAGEISEFRGKQEEAIDAVLAGENVLCLMPTGEGKSLIYQVAGLCLQKTVIVISPLIALMKQHHSYLTEKGLDSLFMSELDYRRQFRETTKIAQGKLPDFILISPERTTTDGYLEYVLREKREEIGLVVIDEAHCVSQWGDGFRPAYKRIPDFINRVFGREKQPQILCLTATLNEADQSQIEQDFAITTTIKSPNLWRENLNLTFSDLGSGKEESKDAQLASILAQHQKEKILVFVHRKYGKRGTTRTLYEQFSNIYPDSAFFDADLSSSEKDRVMEGFRTGAIRIIFATSAFGMGVDIADIRVVVHYLISESVEQYYQEVGRAGRDGKPAFGYLLFTNQSNVARKRLIDLSLCTEKTLRSEYKDRQLRRSDSFGSLRYEDLTEERRIAFALLAEYGIINIAAKGVQTVNCFKANNEEGKEFLARVERAAKTGLVKIVCKREKVAIADLTKEIWHLCAKDALSLRSAPGKAVFYTMEPELAEEKVAQIMADQEAKRKARRAAFDQFAKAIQDNVSPETLVRTTLDL